jgi:hypothetical protein
MPMPCTLRLHYERGVVVASLNPHPTPYTLDPESYSLGGGATTNSPEH